MRLRDCYRASDSGVGECLGQQRGQAVTLAYEGPRARELGTDEKSTGYLATLVPATPNTALALCLFPVMSGVTAFGLL